MTNYNKRFKRKLNRIIIKNCFYHGSAARNLYAYIVRDVKINLRLTILRRIRNDTNVNFEGTTGIVGFIQNHINRFSPKQLEGAYTNLILDFPFV